MLDLIKTVTIVGAFNDTNSFQYQINVPFPVDDVIIKYLCFHNEGGPDPVNGLVIPDGPYLSVIRSDLIDNNVLATFPLVENFFETMNTPFRLSNSNVNNTYTFTVTDILGNIFPFTDLDATIVLVFIKYADK
jgi:hypothetical protein